MNRLTQAAVVALALVTTAAPLAAQAQHRQDQREWRQDRQDRRGDHRADQRDTHRDPRVINRGDRRDHRPNDRWDRNNRNSWSGRPEFRDYRGARSGYWYAPGHGYRRVDPRYAIHRWRQGGYLPPVYRTYYVNDPSYYGLRPAPRGYRYVHANNDIVLIAVATGLIASVLSSVY